MSERLPLQDLTVVVPAFDEARRIRPTIEHLLRWLEPRVERFELVVVDDGSDDRTASIVAGRAAEDPRIRLVSHGANLGKGAAVQSGVRAARGAWILLADADLGVPIEELDVLAPHVGVAPIVIGSKRMPGFDAGQPTWRRILGGVGQWLIRTFCVSGFQDTQCGFKLLRADVAKELFRHARLTGFGYDFELLWLARRAAVDVVEVGVRVADDFGGTVRPWSYVRVLVELALFTWGKLVGAYDRVPARL